MLSKFKSFLLYNANQNNEDSFSKKLREKRFEFFLKYCAGLRKPLTILDLGGSDYHWRKTPVANNKDFSVTIINIEDQNLKDLNNFRFVKKNVSELKDFKKFEFDLVYSNSLIEHINNYDEQKNLADEINRIAEHYFVQTPNYYFPVEPHFLFPFFQFLPLSLKSKLIMNYDLGWFEKQKDKVKASELASSVNLLKKKELKKIFPEGTIYSEKYLFLNKSFIIYK